MTKIKESIWSLFADDRQKYELKTLFNKGDKR